MKQRAILLILWLAAFVLTSCTGGELLAVEPAAGNSAAEPTARPTADLDDPAVQDALRYAEHMGVSPEEAVERMGVQQALSESGLQAALTENEADTFAGLWLQHEPESRVVVAFTRDGEETVRPYVESESFADFVEVRDDYRYTLAKLQAAQQEAMQTLQRLGVSASSSIALEENRVTLTVGNPALLQEELTAAGLALPEPMVVEAIDPNNLSERLRGGVATYQGPEGQTIYLPRQAPTEFYLTAGVDGLLLLDENGCLRLGDEGANERRLILWHADHTLRFQDGIEVLNSSSDVIARVGEAIHGGGGYVDSQPYGIPGVPIEACPGPYILLGSLPSLAEQAIPDLYVYPFHIEDPDRAGIFLAQSAAAPEEVELSGLLLVEERCLRVDGYTVLWPPDVYPDEDADPMALVHRPQGEEGQQVAVVGETVRLPGSERSAEDYRFFENKVDCRGPYWGVSRLPLP